MEYRHKVSYIATVNIYIYTDVSSAYTLKCLVDKLLDPANLKHLDCIFPVCFP